MIQTFFRINGRKLIPALALSLAALTPFRTAYSYVMPTIEVSPLNFVSVASWFAELEKWATQLQNWQAMASRFNPSAITMALNGTQLKKLDFGDEAKFIEQSCPGSNISISLSGLINTALSSIINSGVTDDIPKSQLKLCYLIAKLQVDKYNRTVDIVAQINGYAGQVKNLQELFNNLSDTIATLTGKPLADITNKMQITQQNMSNMQDMMETYKSSMKADDEAIASLQAMQNNLGRIALRGKPTPIGQAVELVTFKSLFD
jgi:hypothetical protein